MLKFLLYNVLLHNLIFVCLDAAFLLFLCCMTGSCCVVLAVCELSLPASAFQVWRPQCRVIKAKGFFKCYCVCVCICGLLRFWHPWLDSIPQFAKVLDTVLHFSSSSFFSSFWTSVTYTLAFLKLSYTLIMVQYFLLWAFSCYLFHFFWEFLMVYLHAC